MRITVNGYITHKEAEKYSDCADNYAYNKDTHRFAISDGVTKSFFPRIWSKILVDKFVALQGAADLSIEECQSKWLDKVTEKVNSPDVKWFTKNAFIQNKSGLATLVTLRFDRGNWYAKALGDSFLFFVPKGKNDFKDWVYLSSKYSSLKSEPVVFDSFPDYYSSREDKHGTENEISGKLEDGKFYLMTDALSEWLFDKKQEALDEIREKWTTQNEFELSINKLRQLGVLNNDDSSVLIIDMENDGKQEFKYMSVNVQDIKDLIKNEDKDDVKKEETFITEALKQKTPTLEIEDPKEPEEQEKINNEHVLQKVEDKLVAINKKINGLFLVNGVLIIFLISGLVYVSVSIKDFKQILSIVNEKEVLKELSTEEKNWDSPENDSMPEKELSDNAQQTIETVKRIYEKAMQEIEKEIKASELKPLSEADSLQLNKILKEHGITFGN